MSRLEKEEVLSQAEGIIQQTGEDPFRVVEVSRESAIIIKKMLLVMRGLTEKYGSHGDKQEIQRNEDQLLRVTGLIDRALEAGGDNVALGLNYEEVENIGRDIIELPGKNQGTDDFDKAMSFLELNYAFREAGGSDHTALREGFEVVIRRATSATNK